MRRPPTESFPAVRRWKGGVMADDVGVDPEWDPTPDAAWSANVLTACGGWKDSDTKYLLQGPCPRCLHKGAISAWVAKEVLTLAVKVEEVKTQPVECTCGHAH